jgi:hypothetical protein
MTTPVPSYITPIREDYLLVKRLGVQTRYDAAYNVQSVTNPVTNVNTDIDRFESGTIAMPAAFGAGNIQYQVIGGWCRLMIPKITLNAAFASNSTGITLPPRLAPLTIVEKIHRNSNATSSYLGMYTFNTDGTINVIKDTNATNWTGAASQTISACEVSFPVAATVSAF